MTNRRELLACIALSLSTALGAEPWNDGDLMAPAELAKQVEAGAAPTIICVTFGVLYRQRHIRGAKYAGPANKPQGIADLKLLAASLPKQVPVVVYCGCCPMKNCPNIRPAFQTLKDLGFEAVRVLNIPTNTHADWVAKGYPTETPA